jgi:hypothetical protein
MRAQTSIEFLIILAVALVALLAFMVLTQSETVGVSDKKIQKDATNAVNDLSSAAEDVYAQGAGAKKQITIYIPYGYEWNQSFIDKKSVKMHVAGNDFVGNVDFDLYGSLPSLPGRHTVWVVSEGEKVRIGTAMVSADVDSINAVMGNNDTRSWRFTLFNTWNKDITVSIAREWNNPNVSMSLSEENMVINKGGSRAIIITFNSQLDSVGFFGGHLNVSADDGVVSESIKIPISVEVLSGKPRREGPQLMIIPSRWNETMARDEVRTKTFQVCTNSDTYLNDVSFDGSVGEPGIWIINNESIGPIDYGVCQAKSLSVQVPINADLGNYSGFVYLEGDVAGAVDALALGVIIGGSEFDTEGPDITNISIFPSRRTIYVQDPVTIRATADDSMHGNNLIEGCEVKVDNGSWYQMIANDGIYDEPAENASYAYFDGFDIGEHTASVRCWDIKNKTSAVTNATFEIMKEFLFISQNPTPETDEQAWIDWIDTGFSQEGYAWNIDTIDSISFLSGYGDRQYYSVLVYSNWIDGMQSEINLFTGSGGTVVFLGQSLADAPAALGFSVQSGNPSANDTYVDIVGVHYITEGFSGDTTIFTNATEQGRFWKDTYGLLLARSPTGSPPHYHILAVSDNIYFWGPYNPDHFSVAGVELSSRTFDHAINASGVGG